MSDLLIDVTDGIATLTMNRTDARNALSLEMRGSMHTFFDEHENDDSVRCVVIKGADEHFMAGGDVKSFAHMAQEQEPDELRRHFLRRIMTSTGSSQQCDDSRNRLLRRSAVRLRAQVSAWPQPAISLSRPKTHSLRWPIVISASARTVRHLRPAAHGRRQESDGNGLARRSSQRSGHGRSRLVQHGRPGRTSIRGNRKACRTFGKRPDPRLRSC